MPIEKRPASAWLRCPWPDPRVRLRLFCLPYAGAGAAQFHAWAPLMPAGVDLCAILLPGREARLREPAYSRLSALAEALADPLLPWLDRPFALFGHSMGAWIAFALARVLRHRFGAEPSHLFVSARPAPHLLVTEVPIHDLPETSFIAELEHRYGRLPEIVRGDAELLQLFLPTLRADLAMIETYTYESAPPFSCPITAFGGADDPRVDRAALSAWREQTTGPFDLTILPGDHYFLKTARDALVRELSVDLRAALGRLPHAGDIAREGYLGEVNAPSL